MKRYIFYTLPVVFLVLFLFRVPFYVPSILLKRTVFIGFTADHDPQAIFEQLRKHRLVYLLGPGTAHRLEKSDFPDLASLSAFLRELPAEKLFAVDRHTTPIASLTPPLGRTKLVVSRAPSFREIDALETLQRQRRLPVELELDTGGYDPLLMAYAYTCGSREAALGFDLLFSPEISKFELIRVFSNGKLKERLEPAGLFEGRHYRTSLPAEGDTTLAFELTGKGETVRREIRVASRKEDAPQLLMISDRAGSDSVLESLYSLKKVPLSQALREDLLEYSLVVFDGVPIEAIDPELTAVLDEIYRQKSSSLLFVSDSPAFGRPGDNPAIEQILPAELTPRSLQYLPDLGILILLDISASMMGEKLSLAKVSTLELVKNLKGSDRVSILTFWDEYRFLHGFEEKSSLDSEVQLAPLVAQGGTDLFSALQEGLDRLIDLSMPQKHVIVLTDGKTKDADFDPLIERALFEDITVSTLAVGEDVNSALLTRIALKSGGNYYRVLDLEEIPSLIFEDRNQIARSSFAEDSFQIYDFTDNQTGRITGMSLFAPKPQRVVLYRNQFEDPLFLMEKRERQLVMMFLSDLYGYYTEDFFSDISVLRTFQTTLDAILKENRINIRVAESLGTISMTVSGQGLVEPALCVYLDNRLLAETELEPGSFRTYSTALTLPRPGRYTAVLYSRGVPFTRLPIYFNGNLEAQTTESRFALQAWKPRSFKALPAGRLYLVLFFILSVGVTYLSRRLPSGRGKMDS